MERLSFRYIEAILRIKKFNMPADNVPQNSDAKPQEPKIPTSNNISYPKIGKSDATHSAMMDDENLENIVNETIEITRNDNNIDKSKADSPVIDDSDEDLDSVRNEEDKQNKGKENKEGKSEKEDKTRNEGSNKGNTSHEPTDEEIARQKKIKIATIAGAAALGAVVMPFAVVGALGAVGFGAAGVTAGSMAAAIQGPAVVSGSAFAICQSIGAAGLGATGITASVLSGGGIGAAFGSLFKRGGKKTKSENIGESSDVTSMMLKGIAARSEPQCGNPKNSSGQTKCNENIPTSKLANDISEDDFGSCNTTETVDIPLLRTVHAEGKKSPVIPKLPGIQKRMLNLTSQKLYKSSLHQRL